MFEDDKDDLATIFEKDVFCRDYKPKKSWVKNPFTEITLKPEGKEMAIQKLYEISYLGKTVYGTKLAVNSQGQWVMEIKGNGDVIAVNKEFVQEVMPHTIGVQFDTSKTVYHYLAEAGKYKVGEFYIFDGQYGRAIVSIKEVDSKSKAATVEFKPLAKILTE